tara:strand:+ start:15337 stop:15630 length:294 start_codon:yes stop_codon:yes gene_type:complete
MRQLNLTEVNVVSGGTDLNKPLLQASFSDVATYFGVYTGFGAGWNTGSKMITFKMAGFEGLVGSVIGGAAGAAVGGLISNAVAHHLLPTTTNLLTGN